MKSREQVERQDRLGRFAARLRIPPVLGRLTPGVIILVVVLVIGSVGYYFLEGWSPLFSFYSTVMVISTLGLVRAPETSGGLGLTIVLVVGGVGTVFYLLGQAAEIIIDSSLGTTQERRMKRQIAALTEHTIICGYGRVGRHAAHEFAGEKRQFVVIDSNLEVTERARADGFTAVLGDATDDAILKGAGVERATSLLITTGSDASNVFITLSARSFNPRLLIIVRAVEDSTEAKLGKAGADHVIAPETIGGKRMAALAIRPDATNIVDNLMAGHNDESWLDQTTVAPGSALAGKRIGDAQLGKDASARIIAIRRRDGQTVINPGRDEYLREGDVLVSVGLREEINELENLSSADQLERNPK